MKTSQPFTLNYVLIDFENVQPKNLSLLQDKRFKVYMFVGSKQTKLDMAIVDVMQKLGSNRAKYVHVKETGKNALDFCLTFYLGAMVAKKPKGYFHIISKDKGFDPLVAHLMELGIKAGRHDCLSQIPIVNAPEKVGKKETKTSEIDKKLAVVLADLKRRGDSKPRKKDALINTLKNIFKNDLSEKEVDRLFRKLVESKQITVNNEKLAYHLTG